MLKLQKETLAELTAEQMAGVVGGQVIGASCVVASCITNDINKTGTIFIRYTEQGC